MNQRVEYYEEEYQVSTVEDNEIVKPEYESDNEVTSSARFGIFDTDRMLVERVNEGSKDYEIVKKSFVSGIINVNVNIVGIHKKRYDWNVMDEARLKAFKLFVAANSKLNGGDANTKYGWFGGSRDEIREILLYGFRRFENRTSSYGRGVYLFPANLPIQSVKASVADSDGLRHVLLCRTILGKSETISFGSQKDQPSSMEFSSGIDNLESPTKYIIWEPYMNTHILPLYIISFQVDSLTGAQSLRKPTSPHMNFRLLMKHLKNYLSSSKMIQLYKVHHEYYEMNKISRATYIRNLREIAGDDVLRAILKGMR
ncbi:probable inactive poly [ADP-ribose] polymerase SRO2 [Rutidosis leptorrhynchoides]|uniref:probable inactive poly [ADP-ribose] polymerase SRO2 n=1 Tax=Rutidosis leptorrhynchoides TaxID=125765 RepID=UPI003A992AE6